MGIEIVPISSRFYFGINSARIFCCKSTHAECVASTMKMMGEMNMYADANQEVSKSRRETRQKPAGDVTSVAVRIRHKTKGQLQQLLKKANKDRLGKKVKLDDLITFALGLITDQHLDEICSKTLSNKDRLELLYRKLSKEKRGMTREEFFGMLLDGKATI